MDWLNVVSVCAEWRLRRPALLRNTTCLRTAAAGGFMAEDAEQAGAHKKKNRHHQPDSPKLEQASETRFAETFSTPGLTRRSVSGFAFQQHFEFVRSIDSFRKTNDEVSTGIGFRQPFRLQFKGYWTCILRQSGQRRQCLRWTNVLIFIRDQTVSCVGCGSPDVSERYILPWSP